MTAFQLRSWATACILTVTCILEIFAQIAPINSRRLLSSITGYRVNDQQPAQCKRRECPHFTLECDTSNNSGITPNNNNVAGADDTDYYVRLLNESTLWAVTIVHGASCQDNSRAFFNLFNYIDGENSEGEKINMTTPVLMVYPLQSAKKSKHSMCVMAFYIGRQHWDNPPQPAHTDLVRLTWIPPHRQFVRVFGGRPDDAEIQRQAVSLHDALLANNEQIETGPHGNTFMLNGYDAPDVRRNRRNEIVFTEFPLHRLLHIDQRHPAKSRIKRQKPTCDHRTE